MTKFKLTLALFLMLGMGCAIAIPPYQIHSVAFELSEDGISHLGWPFQGENWHVTNGSSFHTGDEYYADDWNMDGTQCDDDEGEKVYAVMKGKVLFAGYYNGWGNTVIVRSTENPGFAVRYAHLKKIEVQKWQSTHPETTLIGTVGDTGLSANNYNTGAGCAHLHISLFRNITEGSQALANLEEGRNPSYPNSLSAPLERHAAPFFLDADLAQAGWVSVAYGPSITPSPVVLGEDFSVSVVLQEINGKDKHFEKIAAAILNQNNSLVFDIGMWENVTIPANESWSGTATGYLYTNNQPGNYKAVIRGKLPGAGWFDFDTTGGAKNPIEFQVLAIDSGAGSPGSACGVGQVYDCAMVCVSEAKASNWIGDGYCDNGRWGLVLTCPAFNNDGGDCDAMPAAVPGTACGSGGVYDCSGNCVDAVQAQSWIGDGYCDAGEWGMVLTCPAFSNDSGDCN